MKRSCAQLRKVNVMQYSWPSHKWNEVKRVDDDESEFCGGWTKRLHDRWRGRCSFQGCGAPAIEPFPVKGCLAFSPRKVLQRKLKLRPAVVYLCMKPWPTYTVPGPLSAVFGFSASCLVSTSKLVRYSYVSAEWWATSIPPARRENFAGKSESHGRAFHHNGANPEECRTRFLNEGERAACDIKILTRLNNKFLLLWRNRGKYKLRIVIVHF